jgi:hypothetical protein
VIDVEKLIRLLEEERKRIVWYGGAVEDAVCEAKREVYEELSRMLRECRVKDDGK